MLLFSGSARKNSNFQCRRNVANLQLVFHRDFIENSRNGLVTSFKRIRLYFLFLLLCAEVAFWIPPGADVFLFSLLDLDTIVNLSFFLFRVFSLRLFASLSLDANVSQTLPYLSKAFLFVSIPVGDRVSLMHKSRRRSLSNANSVVNDLDGNSPSKRLAISASMSQLYPFSSILPVVLSASNRDRDYFLSFTSKHKQQFLDSLEKVVGKVVRAHVKPGGDFFIHPHNLKQKADLLKLTKLGEVELLCRKTRAESEIKGVIHGISVDDDLEFIQEALSAQNVVSIRRRQKKAEDGSLVDTRSLELIFSCPLPRSVRLAGDSFIVNKFIPNPMQCENCHRISHLKKWCTFSSRCKNCGQALHKRRMFLSHLLPQLQLR